MASDDETATLNMSEILKDLNGPTPLDIAQAKLREMANEMSSTESRRAFKEQTQNIEKQQTLNGLRA